MISRSRSGLDKCESLDDVSIKERSRQRESLDDVSIIVQASMQKRVSTKGLPRVRGQAFSIFIPAHPAFELPTIRFEIETLSTELSSCRVLMGDKTQSIFQKHFASSPRDATSDACPAASGRAGPPSPAVRPEGEGGSLRKSSV